MSMMATPFRSWLSFSQSVLFIVSLTGASASFALEPPKDRVILTVSGDIGETNAEDKAAFDYPMLEALGSHTIVTSTPWHDQQMTFEGPLARDLLEALDAEGESVRAVALNDYEVTIPTEDFYTYDVILATHANGSRMSVREHGPIFVIYPYDQHTELNQETIYARSAWQVNRLIVD
ncbi:oxidoreductase [Vreelandella massiliensis]|uniref:oxidoreductase n=1 Tax=Vreelandella massiliensis TaxID=1816686 RepID=UPI001F1F9C67|nr:oxidoreductase [Halomonas massiliensis]